MGTPVGQIEKRTQDRVLALLSQRLGYTRMGDWSDGPHSNIEPERLKAWLARQGVSDALAGRAVFELQKAATDTSKSLYDRNHDVYRLLRYGVKVRPEVGENTVTVWLVNWADALANDFAVAEEVSVAGAERVGGARASGKRPDLVLYVNGMALGVLELKRSTVSVSEGIRQNLDNQKKEFIEPFFSTMQWVMAGNDSEGLRYATIETPEKYWLSWAEDSGEFAAEPNLLDRQLLQVCNRQRFLQLIHDFVVFDAGVKKVCRQNQYFGVVAAQDFIRRREGGIIWHTQGSGKSLTMVWLAKWIRENRPAARVLIITDRTELDEQIEKVFRGVNENIYRTRSGADLVATLGQTQESLVCTLVHKFGGRGDEQNHESEAATRAFIEATRQLPAGWKAQGDLHVFVDECHRTQSGDLHRAMKALLPNALIIGFTGTPLLKADKARSLEVFGRYIHTYKFDQAVREGVVLDLRYEARDIDQFITAQKKIDEWFDAKTRGLNDLAKAQLKQRWGTLQRVLSSQSRLEKIVADILLDMSTRPRLMDGHGNAMLVAGSIYEACKFYELFARTELKGKCAIVTSYLPTAADAKGEATGEGETDNLRKYHIYRQMLADWFDESEDQAAGKAERFEIEAKKRFIEQPGQLKLLIVVDKLLTGFDAPPATYLYIDKAMHDHGLFQAICRVNRLDGDDKPYGYIIDYKDLFKPLEGAVRDYTSGAFDSFDQDDVKGLLKDRLAAGRQDLEDAREAIKALCEPVRQPRDMAAYRHFFCAEQSGNVEQLKANEPRRLKLYQYGATLLRAYAALAGELEAAGYTPAEAQAVRAEVDHYTKVRDEVRLSSGDYIDLKAFEPAMRFLIDTYIRAEDSEKISAFDDLSLVQLIVDRGAAAVESLPQSIRKDPTAVAETIENNVRRLIVKETPVDPAYYEKMSKLLDALIDQRRRGVIDYREYLAEIASLTRAATTAGGASASYPPAVDTPAKRALYNNLGGDPLLALALDAAVRSSVQDLWRSSAIKTRRVRAAIHAVMTQHAGRLIDLQADQVRETPQGSLGVPASVIDAATDKVLELAKNQHEY